MWQVHVLSNWTAHAFGEMNLQVQQVLKVALQNCFALDMVLVKEQCVCGVLNNRAGECHVTIHNARTRVEEACSPEDVRNHVQSRRPVPVSVTR